jgi:hypothetical protein
MIMTTMRHFLLAALLAFGLVGSASEAWAEPAPQQVVAKTTQATSGKVTLQVLIVLGTPTGKVDPRAQDLARQFADMNIRGFKVLDEKALVLGDGQSGAIALPDGRKLELQLLSRTAQAAKVRIQMSRGAQTKLDTTVNIQRNRTFVVGGPKTEEGKLIIPVTARY